MSKMNKLTHRGMFFHRSVEYDHQDKYIQHLVVVDRDKGANIHHYRLHKLLKLLKFTVFSLKIDKIQLFFHHQSSRFLPVRQLWHKFDQIYILRYNSNFVIKKALGGG